MAQSISMNAEEFAKVVGEMACRLMVNNGIKGMMYVLFTAKEVEGDPGMFDKGAVISNLTTADDIKMALKHAAAVYDVAGDLEAIEVELPS